MYNQDIQGDLNRVEKNKLLDLKIKIKLILNID